MLKQSCHRPLRGSMMAWLSLPLLAIAQSGEAGAQPAYAVKPSQVALPPDATLGSYRRIIQPFENWDLICDENLVSMTKICNVTQTIIDTDGVLVFGWSLAATEQGDPMMIIRVRSDIAAGQPILLQFSEADTPVLADISGCDASVCTALLAVDLPLKRVIADGAIIVVSYSTGTDERTIKAPLEGLNTALLAIE